MTPSATNNLSVFPCDTMYRARDYATITITVTATIIMALITVIPIIIRLDTFEHAMLCDDWINHCSISAFPILLWVYLLWIDVKIMHVLLIYFKRIVSNFYECRKTF